MKNNITQFSLILIAFIAVNFLMSFAKPAAADEPKQYMLVQVDGSSRRGFEQAVSEKLNEGWHVQGGATTFNGFFIQAMIK